MFDPQTYSSRRQKLAGKLQSGVILLLGHHDSPMNYDDNIYPFRQDSTFLYYVGLSKQGLAAVIDVESGQSTVFGHPPTISDVIWSGPQPSLDDLARMSGAEHAAPVGDLAQNLHHAVSQGRPVHYLPPYRTKTRSWLSELLGSSAANPDAGVSVDLIRAVVAQRSVKENQEIAEISSALKVTANMHLMAMQHSRPGTFEREVAGLIEGLAIGGGGRLAYPCIFTRNGEVLHNHTYSQELKEGDLVVNDSGAASARQYASDITRTIPVSGQFSDRQRVIYKAVLKALEGALQQVGPNTRYKDIHLDSARSITRSLQEAHLMKGDLEQSVQAGAHALFYPHGLGHMIGLDVHDMEDLGEDYVGYDAETTRSSQFGLRYLRLGKSLKEGYVLTVEPGCYFIGPLIDQWRGESRHSDFINYDELVHWRGLGGVRIEENVVVTASGCRVLGPPIPRSVEDVEAACVR